MLIGGTRWPRERKRQLSLVTTKLLPGVLLLNGHGVPVSERSKARPPFLPWASAFPCLPLFSSQKWVAIISSISQMRRLRHSWDSNPGLLVNVQGSFHVTVSLWLRMHEDIYGTSSMCPVLSARGLGQWSHSSCCSSSVEGIYFALLETLSVSIQKTKLFPGCSEATSQLVAPIKSTHHTETKRTFKNK